MNENGRSNLWVAEAEPAIHAERTKYPARGTAWVAHRLGQPVVSVSQRTTEPHSHWEGRRGTQPHGPTSDVLSRSWPTWQLEIMLNFVTGFYHNGCYIHSIPEIARRSDLPYLCLRASIEI